MFPFTCSSVSPTKLQIPLRTGFSIICASQIHVVCGTWQVCPKCWLGESSQLLRPVNFLPFVSCPLFCSFKLSSSCMNYCKAYLMLSPIFHCLPTATRIVSWKLTPLVKNLPEKLKTKFPAMYSKLPKNWPQITSSLTFHHFLLQTLFSGLH